VAVATVEVGAMEGAASWPAPVELATSEAAETAGVESPAAPAEEAASLLGAMEEAAFWLEPVEEAAAAEASVSAAASRRTMRTAPPDSFSVSVIVTSWVPDPEDTDDVNTMMRMLLPVVWPTSIRSVAVPNVIPDADKACPDSEVVSSGPDHPMRSWSPAASSTPVQVTDVFDPPPE
jgi:hypothetical protein